MTKKDVTNLIIEREHFILTTHEGPDGDALGSQVAFALFLSSLNKKVYIVNADNSEIRYDFFCKHFPSITPQQWPSTEKIENYSLLILDTVADNIGSSMEPFLQSCKEHASLDHHDTLNEQNIYPGYYNPHASSTCELIYEFIEDLKGEITLPMAEALFTGIVFDTGSFRYRKTTHRTLEIASNLVQIGVIPFRVHTLIYESNTKESLMLLSKVLSSLEFYFKDRVSLLEMSGELLHSSGASFEEAQTLINIPLSCRTVELSIFLKEDDTGHKRCSLRSKGNFNCLLIAEQFGGGGHETAAGFKIKNNSFSGMKQKVLEVIKPFFT